MLNNPTYLGLWLDYREAHLVRLADGQVETEQLTSEVEDFNVRGGSRSETPFGPQENVAERRYQERKRHQVKAFWELLLPAINQATSVYLIGPGMAKKEFLHFLEATMKSDIPPIKLENASRMTPRQLIAKVKAHFELSPRWTSVSKAQTRK
ncbi:MAG: hypothetical protein AAFR61_01230 [Bacteroidota bacterium]